MRPLALLRVLQREVNTLIKGFSRCNEVVNDFNILSINRKMSIKNPFGFDRCITAVKTVLSFMTACFIFALNKFFATFSRSSGASKASIFVFILVEFMANNKLYNLHEWYENFIIAVIFLLSVWENVSATTYEQWSRLSPLESQPDPTCTLNDAIFFIIYLHLSSRLASIHLLVHPIAT